MENRLMVTSGTYPLWESLVDENRLNTFRYPKPAIFPIIIYKVADRKLVEEAIDPHGWNEVPIKAPAKNQTFLFSP